MLVGSRLPGHPCGCACVVSLVGRGLGPATTGADGFSLRVAVVVWTACSSVPQAVANAQRARAQKPRDNRVTIRDMDSP